MVGRLLVGFVWLNVLFSVSWQVDFQWGSCGQSLVFCVMVGRLLGGFVWLNLKFSVSWQVDFQWGSCGSIFCFLCQGCQLLVGFVWLNVQFSVSWLVEFQWGSWGSCGSIFSFLRHGSHTFNGVRVFQSLVFCVMVGRPLVSWLGDLQWGSCGSNFSFLCHGRQTFSGVRVAQSLVFCVMVGRHLVGFVRLNLQFSVSRLATFSGVRVAQSLLFCLMVGRLLVGSCGSFFFFFCVMIGGLLVGFLWLNLLFSVSWLVDFQWASCVSIFSFLCHGWQTFSGLRVSQSLDFCVMVGILLVGFVWLNLLFSVSWLVDFQWGSCGSIFSFLCHGRQTFSGVRVAPSLVFCVMVGRLLVEFVWLNLQSSVSSQVDFQWVSCGSIFTFLCHGWQTFSGVRVAQSFVFCVKVANFQWDSCGSIFSFLCHGWQTFSGVRVAQSLVFCVMVRILLMGFVWLKLQFSVSWQVDFQWGSCGSIFSFLRHGWQTFSGVREAQSLVFWVKVVDFQKVSCGSIFTFLSHGWQNFSRVVWLNLLFSVS